MEWRRRGRTESWKILSTPLAKSTRRGTETKARRGQRGMSELKEKDKLRERTGAGTERSRRRKKVEGGRYLRSAKVVV